MKAQVVILLFALVIGLKVTSSSGSPDDYKRMSCMCVQYLLEHLTHILNFCLKYLSNTDQNICGFVANGSCVENLIVVPENEALPHLLGTDSNDSGPLATTETLKDQDQS